MANYMELDADSIAKIGLMFLDGDSLEDVLLDKVGHTDYNFDKFNICKITLMKIERINPSLDIAGVIWQRRVDNPDIAIPVIAGKSLPYEGWQRTYVTDEMRRGFEGEFGTVKTRPAGASSHYYPIRNSDYEIVGVLELIAGSREQHDI
jgi:hypothetical protein